MGKKARRWLVGAVALLASAGAVRAQLPQFTVTIPGTVLQEVQRYTLPGSNAIALRIKASPGMSVSYSNYSDAASRPTTVTMLTITVPGDSPDRDARLDLLHECSNLALLAQGEPDSYSFLLTVTLGRSTNLAQPQYASWWLSVTLNQGEIYLWQCRLVRN